MLVIVLYVSGFKETHYIEDLYLACRYADLKRLDDCVRAVTLECVCARKLRPI